MHMHAYMHHVHVRCLLGCDKLPVCMFIQAKGLAVELYRWAGAGIRPTLEKNLKPVQVQCEL